MRIIPLLVIGTIDLAELVVTGTAGAVAAVFTGVVAAVFTGVVAAVLVEPAIWRDINTYVSKKITMIDIETINATNICIYRQKKYLQLIFISILYVILFLAFCA